MVMKKTTTTTSTFLNLIKHHQIRTAQKGRFFLVLFVKFCYPKTGLIYNREKALAKQRKTIEEIKSLLKENQLRITQTRLDVAKVLLDNLGSPMSPEEIFNQITSSSIPCDQVSVYRILGTFEDIGLVIKSKFQGEASRYMVDECGKTHKHHHHFFKCVSCNTVEPFDGCFIGKKEKDLASKGYTSLQHHIEITGICPGCTDSKKQQSAPAG